MATPVTGLAQILAVTTSVDLFTVVVPTGPTADRSFLPTTAPAGNTVVVTIAAAEYGGLGEVMETLIGYAYVEGSSTLSGVEVSDDGGTLSFILTGETSFRYSVTVPSAEVTHSITGVVKDLLASPVKEAGLAGFPA